MRKKIFTEIEKKETDGDPMKIFIEWFIDQNVNYIGYEERRRLWKKVRSDKSEVENNILTGIENLIFAASKAGIYVEKSMIVKIIPTLTTQLGEGFRDYYKKKYELAKRA